MGSSAEEHDGVRVRGEPCVCGGARWVRWRPLHIHAHMRIYVRLCVYVCARAGERASVCVFVHV